MLILINNNESNQRSIALLQKNYLDINNNAFCFVIDTEQLYFKKNLKPEHYAQLLINSGLPSSITDLYILTSQIEKDHFMAVFAQNLVRSFAEFHHRSIKVHIPSCLSYEVTLIVPSPEHNRWKIYGINHSELTQNDFVFGKILAEKNINTVWEGEDLLEWMNDPQQTYSNNAYAWGQP